MLGGSSRIDLAMFKVWMKISPPCEVSMCERTLAPDLVLDGISSMTLRPLRRKLVRHDEWRLLTSMGVTRETWVQL